MRKRNLNTVLAVLITVMLVVDFGIFKKIVTDSVPQADYENNSGTESEQTLTPEQKAERDRLYDIEQNYTDISALSSDTKCGELILVNKAHEFDFNAQTKLFEIEYPESIYQSKTDSYFVKNINISLNKTAILALNELLDDFYAETGHDDIIIVDAFRSFETQKIVLDAKIAEYGEEKGRLIATEPGASEHHTGYAIDLSLYIDGIQQDYDGTGDYEWITENCYKYGFVIRYPEGKTNVTGIDYEPWHLRYVGKAHAQYMTENNLCLEEYIQKLSYYPINSGRLSVNTFDNKSYEIYYCPVNSDTSYIKVPKNYPYTLSGDNCGGIIVTVDKTAVNTESAGNTGNVTESSENPEAVTGENTGE